MKNTRKANVVVVVALLLCLVTGGVSAAPLQRANDTGGGIVPYFTCIDTVSASLSISGGKATCSSTMVGYSSICTSSSLYVELQYLSAGSWVTYTSWTAYGDFITDVYETCSVPKGHTYQLKVTATAYTSGSDSEQAVCYSNTVNYY